MKQKFVAFLILFFLLVSCKKDENSSLKNDLPNYGNVELDDVFNKEDSKLINESEIENTLQLYYDKVWEKGELSGGFLVAKGDKILFEKYRGYAKENDQIPITKNVPLHVASVSKTLTAMAVLKLVEAGKIKLHQKVTDFFPKFPYPEVEVFHLITHRSGLPKYEYVIDEMKLNPPHGKYFTNQDVLDLLIKNKPELARNTNTGFMYCNTNFALLALIIEKVTKNSFPIAMQKMIFQPLKMKHSYIFQPKDSLRAAQSFYNRGNKLFPNDKLDWIYGDKNCYTTPRDLLNFSKAMFSEKFLRKSLKDSIFQPYSNERPGVNNYGMGFRMKNFDNGERLIYHNGWWHGSNSSFSHLLKSKVTIIAIGNRFSGRVYSALALSGLFEDFPPEKEKLAKVLSDEKEQPKEISEPKEVSGDVTE
ncbi:penicillin-binding protein [Cloacibacterium rupense]|uniref:Penicillin-binding protein n=1 Tax=Cloacibacterium rupense TaxID=517423 RepID=A0ABQ2NI88_9FLAO|nr:serine hydrolase domain-containing protein [Cloacibacterium rupense]GGP04056.1 penicillin-binding protein [Cloacibacterium rupense]